MSSRITDARNAANAELDRQFAEIDALGLDPVKDEAKILMLKYQAQTQNDGIQLTAHTNLLKAEGDLLKIQADAIKV